jgi:hypothetical protein
MHAKYTITRGFLDKREAIEECPSVEQIARRSPELKTNIGDLLGF